MLYEFILDSDSTNARENAEGLNSLLSEFGIEVTYADNSQRLKIKIDTNKYTKKKTRGAGKKRTYNTDLIQYTYGDIKNWRVQGLPMQEIAKILHVSRATLYRRLQEAEELGIKDTESWMG